MKKDGFTLVELLAVIAMIAAILLITVPIMIKVVDNAKDNTYRNAVRSLFDSVKLKVVDDRTITNGNISILETNDKSIISGSWEYNSSTGNIILSNLLLSDGRYVCNIEYKDRSTNFAIQESC